MIRARRETVESLTGCARMRNAFARTATRDWIVYHFEYADRAASRASVMAWLFVSFFVCFVIQDVRVS